MPLGIAQLEEVARLLRDARPLVDRMADLDSGFSAAVMAWLKRAETVLENNRLPVVSRVAGLRAMLIASARGQIPQEIVVQGRPTRRKVSDLVAAHVLRAASELVSSAVAKRSEFLEEAERVAGQVAAVARAKGLVSRCRPAGSHQEVLMTLRHVITADSDLAAAWTHLEGIAGAQDALLLLDRALPELS